ncbi:MAG: hypothetical protein LBG75_01610 [Candidatus Nomurabacteria bacterium]|jgi:hypothetical protein|nr:hypothetical protein [Candidatus Nomurabacteria bacterium]
MITDTVNRARLYVLFRNMASLLQKYDATKDHDRKQYLATRLEAELKLVDKSLANQITHKIVAHRHINDIDSLKAELQGATATPELDVRFDKNGKGWVSHSPRTGLPWVSPMLHKLTSQQITQRGKRLSLDDALHLIAKYKRDNKHHRVVIELKELGPNARFDNRCLEGVKQSLESSRLTGSVSIATLSPYILTLAHAKMPGVPLFLNGGVTPVFSRHLAYNANSSKGKGRTLTVLKLPNIELLAASSSQVSQRADGYGKHTAYLYTRYPNKVVDIMREHHRNESGGAVFLTVVNIMAQLLDKFSTHQGKKLRQYYADQFDELGVAKGSGISRRDSLQSYKKVKSQFGADTVIYANDNPGQWAYEISS